MSPCLVLCFILMLQLVAGFSSSGNVSSPRDSGDAFTPSTGQPAKSGETMWPITVEMNVTKGNAETSDPQGECAWWCNELYGIITLAAVGFIFFFTIILCSAVCCLWMKIQLSKKEGLKSNNTDMKDMEMDMLGRQDPPDTTILPIPDVGPSDAEICTVNLELSKKETPQGPVDHPDNEAPMFYPPPEDIPMLP